VRRFIAVLTFAVIAWPTAGSAQLVVKGGLSFAKVTESAYLPNLDMRTGFAAGISLGLPMGGLTVRPEVFFVQKGGKLANDASFELNELNVPLLLQFTFPVPVLSPFLLAGPQAEYELTCTKADVDCVDTNSLRWGFVVGAGAHVGGLTVEGRYDWTLSNLADDIHSKPRTIMLLVGLPLGG